MISPYGSHFDNSDKIGNIIVSRYVEKSSNSIFTDCECISETDARFKFVYETLIQAGGKKHFLQRKERFIIDSFLSRVENYVTFASLIELHCAFKSGKNLFWQGSGHLKKMSSADFAELSRTLGTSEDGDAEVQINISAIFDELREFLEFPEGFDI